MLSNFSVRKPYTVVVAVVLIIILGIVSFMNISTDLLPSINLPYSVIITSYAGASPEEVEMIVTKPIEQSMASISNIKSVRSVSREHVSLVILEFGESTNMDSAVIEMRESLDMLATYMPDGVGASNIMKLNPDMMPVMVLSAAVAGQDISESSAFLERVIVPELESIEGVASVDVSGLVENEIHIILSDDKINDINKEIETIITAQMALAAQAAAASGQMMPPADSTTMQSPTISISKDMISGLLKGQNFSMPTGYITESGVSYLVRTGDKIEDLDALKSMVVMHLPFEGLEPITLEDVADVIFSNNASEMYSKVNGTDAITLTIQKQTSYVTSDISKSIHARIDSIQKQHSNVEMVILMDQGEYIDIVVNSLSMNLVFGGILAVFVLLLFLRDFKPTLIVGVAIPISLVAAFVLMYFSDITLNIISMGGLALGVGMLVDNAIVVIENIYRMRHEGLDAKEAAVAGAKQVSGAIMASTLTTVAVFVPIVFVEGFTREIFQDMGLTIAYSLLASLVIALTLVPTMASKLLINDANKDHPFFERLKRGYTIVLKSALKHKFITIALVLGLFVGSIFGALSMGTELFPSMDSGELNGTLTLPVGSDFGALVTAGDYISEQILSIEGVESVGISAGGGTFGMSAIAGGGSTNSASLYITLSEERKLSTLEITDLITAIPPIAEYDLKVSGTDMNMGAMTGGAISINIKGQDFDTLEKMANEVADLVRSVEGTADVLSGIEETSPEYRVVVDKQLSVKYGLTVAQVFMEVNQLLAKESATTSINTDSGDINVFVYDATINQAITKEDILNLTLQSPLGEPVLLSDIATLEAANGFKSIGRINQQRYVTITGNLESNYNIGTVSAEIEKKLATYHVPTGYSIEMSGENETINNSFKDLSLMLLLGVLFIYLIMVAQFQSLLSPFIVMFTIPLAFTGGFLALMLVGMPLSIVAFIGLIVLAGVVVNNGIVFVDYANKMREEGHSKYDALIKTGNDRLRPILMTALTTIIALSTMSLGAGTGTEMMQPMAITAIGGLIYATLLTLVLIPVLYDIVHRK